MRAYLFALEVEPFEEGKVYEALPLHCTVMPWFGTSKSQQMVMSVCAPCFENCGTIKLISVAQAFFGKNCTLPVHTVKQTRKLMALHRSLIEKMYLLDAIPYEPEYRGKGFNPHITTHGSRSFAPPKRLKTNTVSLVEALNVKQLKDKKVLTRITLE